MVAFDIRSKRVVGDAVVRSNLDEEKLMVVEASNRAQRKIECVNSVARLSDSLNSVSVSKRD